MPSTEDQLNKDRELLIRIDENTRSLRETFHKHAEEDAARFHAQGQKIDAVHERLDEFDGLKNRVWGAIAVIAVLWGVIIVVLDHFKK